MPPRALDEQDCCDQRARKRRDDAGARPSPRAALDDPEREQRHGDRQQQRAAQIGQRSSPRRTALDEEAPSESDRADAEREVDQKDEPPVVGVDERTAERRTEPGRRSGRGAPQPDRMSAALRRERLDDQGERRGHEQRSAGGLDGAGRDQERQRRRDRAQHRRDREENDSRREHAGVCRTGRRTAPPRRGTRRRRCCRR